MIPKVHTFLAYCTPPGDMWVLGAPRSLYVIPFAGGREGK